MKIIISRAVLQQRGWALGLPRILRNEVLRERCLSLQKGRFCLRNILTGSHELTVKTPETTPSHASNVLSPALWQPPWRDWWSRMCCLGPPGNKCQKPATNMAPEAFSAVQLPTNTYKTTIQRVWKWSWGQRTDEAISSRQNLSEFAKTKSPRYLNRECPTSFAGPAEQAGGAESLLGPRGSLHLPQHLVARSYSFEE